MNGSERSLERLSTHYWHGGRLVKHSSNRGLLVMAVSLTRKHNASKDELCHVLWEIGESRKLEHIDRRKLGAYLRRLYERLPSDVHPLLSPRYVRLGYSLWQHCYPIYSRFQFERSVKHFCYFRDLRDLGFREISEIILKIRKEPRLHYDPRRYTIARPWLR